ncbi:transmembrane 7 superfamily member 3-like [Anthonomus grandis grandis]|uniref:transmembrane 7 superfamily member 3-like n=1 Tax=Anthonomus grandis grandis TaxID=2921223 RepID=UPI0021652E80|nr:transmembrane 7 superfamily member 3-like [Anthonomus grandis grandis]
MFKNMLTCKNMLLGSTLFISLFACACSADILDHTIIFDVKHQTIGTTSYEIFNITKFNYFIDIINIPKVVDFLIIQVHTLNENVTLAYTSWDKSHTSGTNVGLVKITFGNTRETFQLFRYEAGFNQALNILVAVSVYTKNDPIPGGCNDSFETEFAPYQKISFTKEIVTVRSQPPSQFSTLCNKSGIVTDMYYMYLPESENIMEYFVAIQKMLNAEDIKLYGTKVPYGLEPNKYNLMYNNYRGIGRVFAIVATSDRGRSAYVPAVSFGCSTGKSGENCTGPDEFPWALVIALMLILGLFICFFGHRFFKTTTFVNTAMLIVFFMMIATTLDDEFTSEGKSVYSLLMGAVVGGVWVFLWWWLGIPVLAVLTTFLLTGILIASVFFFIPYGNLSTLFGGRFTFWAIFGAIVLICQLPLFYLTPTAHIMAISLLSSYAVIVALNYYIAGNLYYIIINTYRRIAIDKFEEVVIDPPYHFANISATVLWVILFLAGVYFQWKNSVGRPPFPPHRRRSLNGGANWERRPLINRETPSPDYSQH